MDSNVIIAVLGVALAVSVAYPLGKLAFRTDEKIENRRRGYITLAGFLKEYGLERIPRVLINAAVGDKSGVADEIIVLVELLRSDPDIVAKEFDKVFDRVLSAKLLKPEAVAYIKSKIAETEKANVAA